MNGAMSSVDSTSGLGPERRLQWYSDFLSEQDGETETSSCSRAEFLCPETKTGGGNASDQRSITWKSHNCIDSLI